ncbi:hypothetical protein BS50DRAFT_34665 [Corynespora cassiicola Philippines]|uniref:Uncharacterized protein n=1 Tax=Corynespora cassiicola Philippines TaxID=1448308 RepID=A0A2T2PBZ8_CORCC|nr:hypothetical protein BS50DRAFT_34665 [Corynespora cassiicola Philippines]
MEPWRRSRTVGEGGLWLACWRGSSTDASGLVAWWHAASSSTAALLPCRPGVWREPARTAMRARCSRPGQSRPTAKPMGTRRQIPPHTSPRSNNPIRTAGNWELGARRPLLLCNRPDPPSCVLSRLCSALAPSPPPPTPPGALMPKACRVHLC